MIKLDTDLPGKKTTFGDARRVLGEHGIEMSGNWDFDRGMFDAIIFEDGDDTIYLRLPFEVTEGMLDEDSADIIFGTPFIIKHLLNIGLDDEENTALAATGLDQFQKPDDPDAPIKYDEKWAKEGEEIISRFSDNPVFTL